MLVIGANAADEPVPRKSKTNFIIIYADDLGYGDLASYGHPTIKTPNLDRLAAQGQRWTNFYSAANVCTPSRAALLTGRLPIRNGMCSNHRRVLFPDSGGGLPQSENTIARLLKGEGYKTASIGKWHLGHLPGFRPTDHGFDSYFGIPYSNDMDRIQSMHARDAIMDPKIEYFQVPLIRDTVEIERPADQRTIVKRYTDEALKFISANKKEPFFLYYAHSFPHVPLFVSDQFKGKSERGLYGDVVEEIDWSVGQIMERLRKEKLDENTMVIFSSDNGPWVIFDEHGGSAGPFFGAKGTGYEGGQRVPAIFSMPGSIQPGTITEMGSTLDILPTIANWIGMDVPSDRKYDGYDLSEVLRRKAPSPREEMYFYHGTRLFALRKGDHKIHFYKNNPIGYPEQMEKLDTVRLYHLGHDPGEQYNIAAKQQSVVEELMEFARQHRASLDSMHTQLEKRIVIK